LANPSKRSGCSANGYDLGDVAMDIGAIFQREATHLFWNRIDDDHITEGATGKAIEFDEAYFTVRMNEVFLRRIRLLWRKYYPMLHGFTDYTDQEDHAIAGPGQLQNLGNVNLDRVITLNYRLTGPTAYKGGDVSILVGLYSVPGQDVAKALISTIGTLASFGGPQFGQAVQIAGIVKDGVDKILGLGDTKLQLGVHDSFFPNGNPLRSGYYVGIAAPATQIDASHLWLKDGRLVKGADPIASRPYEEYDYMVLSIERSDRRDDWPLLPGLNDFNAKFGAIMADSGLDANEKAKRLNDIWPTFTQALKDSRFLIRPDRERIAGDVQQDLGKRLKAIRTGGPFETRGWRESATRPQQPSEFDLADVPEYIDLSESESARVGKAALDSPPAF
jgi:hypothetical protein